MVHTILCIREGSKDIGSLQDYNIIREKTHVPVKELYINEQF